MLATGLDHTEYRKGKGSKDAGMFAVPGAQDAAGGIADVVVTASAHWSRNTVVVAGGATKAEDLSTAVAGMAATDLTMDDPGSAARVFGVVPTAAFAGAEVATAGTGLATAAGDAALATDLTTDEP